jgi:DNA-binding transcriptional ArsR family regulator
VTDADFLFLQRTTGLTKRNLSSHLAKLEDAGLVRIDKRFAKPCGNLGAAVLAPPQGRAVGLTGGARARSC